jgi:predicted small secreted protein
MSSRRYLLALAGCVVLGGCNTANKHIGEEDPFLGEAVKYNAAIQTINPSPIYPEGGAQPGDSGVKGAAAVKRYRSDQVKQPQAVSTSSGPG